jgi:pilus assembly protein CpaE
VNGPEILLITPDTDFELAVKHALSGRYDEERRWDPSLPRLHPHQAVEKLAAPDSSVVVLGPGLPSAEALDIAAALDVLRPDVCCVVVAKPSGPLYELAIRAGVRELIPPASTPEELARALLRAADAASRRQVTTASRALAAEEKVGRVITVLSSKGGTGKTTMASNLAVGLAKGAPGRVAVVDLDLQFGDVASAISLAPHSTVADAARANGGLDRTTLKVFLEPHPGGFYVLAAPHFPAEADEVSATTVGHVLELLAREFDYVVVDTAAGLDEHALTAAERSSDLVLVCATDVPSVRSLRKALDALDLLGMTGAQRHFVLNRSDARVGLSQRDIEATVGMPVDVSVPSSRTVPISVNQGSPVIASDPRSPVSKALTQLVYRFFVAAPPAVRRAS